MHSSSEIFLSKRNWEQRSSLTGGEVLIVGQTSQIGNLERVTSGKPAKRRLTCQNKDSSNRPGLNVSSINTRARLHRGLLAGANRYCSCISAENCAQERDIRRVAIGQKIDLFWCAHKAFASRRFFFSSSLSWASRAFQLVGC